VANKRIFISTVVCKQRTNTFIDVVCKLEQSSSGGHFGQSRRPNVKITSLLCGKYVKPIKGRVQYLCDKINTYITTSRKVTWGTWSVVPKTMEW